MGEFVDLEMVSMDREENCDFPVVSDSVASGMGMIFIPANTAVFFVRAIAAEAGLDFDLCSCEAFCRKCWQILIIVSHNWHIGIVLLWVQYLFIPVLAKAS